MKRTLFTVEAKSTVGKAAYIPNDQIVRCIDILDMFSIYRQRDVVFAFKFAKSNDNPSLKYYFIRFNPYGLKGVKTLKCYNTGKLVMYKEVPGMELDLYFNTYKNIQLLRDMHNNPFTESL